MLECSNQTLIPFSHDALETGHAPFKLRGSTEFSFVHNPTSKSACTTAAPPRLANPRRDVGSALAALDIFAVRQSRPMQGAHSLFTPPLSTRPFTRLFSKPVHDQ